MPGGRKFLPACECHVWTLEALRERCGAEDNEECWDHYRGRYGQVPKHEQVRKHPTVVHGKVRMPLRRLAWFLAFGENPPEGMSLVMAKCDNQRCQNPWHAKPMWEAQKVQRAADRGAYSTVQRRMKIAAYKQAHSKKLDWDKVERLRADPTPAREQPWKKYGISESMWKRIRAHRAWVCRDSALVFSRMGL